jgi:glycerophosphoryl diester phosphodiesterase
MAGLDWLTARPVAHRGLHDASHGVIENTPAAFAAAIAGSYAIECDLQLSADGEAMVFHDRTLERLTEATGAVASKSAAELSQIAFKGTPDHMLTLAQLCDLVHGRVPLILEMKSAFDGDARLPARVADVLRTYAGPVAAMSFDPEQIAALGLHAPGLPRGIVAESRYDHPEWSQLRPADRRRLAHLLHAGRTRPHFVAYAVNDLPAAAPLIARWLFGLPLLTWTVRTDAQRTRAKRWADQIIFEGFRP